MAHRSKRNRLILLGVLTPLVVAAILHRPLTRYLFAAIQMVHGKKTIDERVEEYGPAVRKRLADDFKRAGLAYPPTRLTLVCLKRERRLELWAAGDEDAPQRQRQRLRLRLLKHYPILGASGSLGPKLREGDRQVPEGLYEIESLNPNSRFHLALRVNYPNAFDKAQAQRDGRDNLGGDIMIHGGDRSIGCLAMGDAAAEELFVLAAETGVKNIRVILSPIDFRADELPQDKAIPPAWTPMLYRQIRQALDALRPPDKALAPA